MPTNFRDAAWALSPPRLRTDLAARMVYALISLPLEGLAQEAEDAIFARFPDLCPEDALAYHGRDRSIVRGPLEPSDSYRIRLRLWIEAWRGAGVGRAMLDQIAGYLTPNTCRIRIWSQVGVVYTREADGTFTIERAAPTAWNWDGETALWARFWVVIYSLDGVPWSRKKWGDGRRWGDTVGGTWGSSALISEVRSIRGIIDSFKPAPSVCQNIIVAFDSAAFDPSDASPPLPDGTWGNWSKRVAGVRVPARDSRAIYWDGVA